VLDIAECESIKDAEVYWFEPLDQRFAHLIEESRRFIRSLAVRA
jgi:hypothetical protein